MHQEALERKAPQVTQVPLENVENRVCLDGGVCKGHKEKLGLMVPLDWTVLKVLREHRVTLVH